MLKLIFKNVGQGDSIMLEWKTETLTKYGIIDCRKYYGQNPILEHLQNEKSPKVIDFFFISHGHDDHYSGVNDVIDYCEKENITINHFISTLHPVQFQYFKISKSYQESKRIVALLKRINSIVQQKGIIKTAYPASNLIQKFKINEYKLECVYPRQRDYTKLGQALEKYIKGERKSRPDLNEIATFLKIHTDDILLILTSDCTIETLKFCEQKDDDLKVKRLHLAQVPHHGSKHNHYPQFWRKLKRIEKCPAVISSGSGKDNLPDAEVVEDIHEIGYELYATNFVNGIKEFFDDAESKIDDSSSFDLFFELEEEYIYKPDKDRFVGDKLFELDSVGVAYT